jgi:membrane-associated phospholipid phosphatase
MLVWKIISLYEVIFLGILALYIVAQKNRRLLYFLFFNAVIVHGSVSAIKYSLPQEKYAFNKRPELAKNCNTFGNGGTCQTPGFPSGHSTGAVFLFSYFFFSRKGWNIVNSITLLFAILVPISRVQLHCHTILQVIVGSIYGFCLGFLYTFFVEPFFLRGL